MEITGIKDIDMLIVQWKHEFENYDKIKLLKQFCYHIKINFDHEKDGFSGFSKLEKFNSLFENVDFVYENISKYMKNYEGGNYELISINILNNFYDVFVLLETDEQKKYDSKIQTKISIKKFNCDWSPDYLMDFEKYIPIFKISNYS